MTDRWGFQALETAQLRLPTKAVWKASWSNFKPLVTFVIPEGMGNASGLMRGKQSLSLQKGGERKTLEPWAGKNRSTYKMR